MFMNRFILFSAILFSLTFVYAESFSANHTTPELASKDAKGFITHNHALYCIQLDNTVLKSQQQLVNFETRKANLKSKIDYLQKQIHIKRKKIEALDQKNYQGNNKNYNQLVDQFESLVAERKQAIAQYADENQQHLTHNQQYIDIQNTYNEQCLNHIKITKKLHEEVCISSSLAWCAGFSFPDDKS